MLQRDTTDKPCTIKTFTQRRSVTSAFFHHLDGNKLLTTCYDDYIRFYTNVLDQATIQPHTMIRHNNQSGKWITTFKTIWDNKDSDNPYFLVGDMEKSVSIFDGNSGTLIKKLFCENLTAQPAVNAIHPVIDLIGSGTARGKVAIWS